MTELEMIARAKMYVDKLANGINPIDDTIIPEQDIVNNVRLARCFFFVSDVLRRVLENGGTNPAPGTKKVKKIPFSLSDTQRDMFVFSIKPVSMSEIVGQLNSLANNESMQKISYRIVTEWLIEIGMLSWTTNSLGKSQKYPTVKGNQQGITVEERTGAQGAYHVVVYSTSAQHFIIEHLNDIITSHAAKTELTGKPWAPDHDEHLKELS